MKNIIITSFMGIGNTINLIPLAEYFSKQGKDVYFLIYNKPSFDILEHNPFIKESFFIPKGKSLIKNFLFSRKLRKKINPKETLFISSYPHGPRREKFISQFYNAEKSITINLLQNEHDVITNLFPFKKNKKYVRPKIYFSKKEIKFKENFLKKKGLDSKSYVVGIHPGCDKRNEKKRLPKEKYIKIIKKLICENKKIFLFLGPSEIEMKPDFEDNLKDKLNKSVFIISEKINHSNNHQNSSFEKLNLLIKKFLNQLSKK